MSQGPGLGEKVPGNGGYACAALPNSSVTIVCMTTAQPVCDHNDPMP